jgi:hypothetical protein
MLSKMDLTFELLLLNCNVAYILTFGNMRMHILLRLWPAMHATTVFALLDRVVASRKEEPGAVSFLDWAA